MSLAYAASVFGISRGKSAVQIIIAGRQLYPSGFVFHESRVGATLVASILGSNPINRIFSESTPPANAFLRCRGYSHERRLEVFRDTLLMMGRRPIHRRIYIKFQFIISTKMKITLEVLLLLLLLLC